MDSSENIKTNNRIIWADLLRIASIFSVVFLHTASAQWDVLNIASLDWQIANFYKCLSRWGVPIFIMISGMFFLNPKKNIPLKHLYSVNILRLALSYFFWTALYFFTIYLLSNQPLNIKKALEIFHLILKGETSFHLWFVPMLIGLYIVTPILRVFVSQAKNSDYTYFFITSFIFASLIPLILQIAPFAIYEKLILNLKLNLVIGYTSLFVLGIYLKETQIDAYLAKKIYLYGLLSSILTVLLTVFYSQQLHKQSELFLEYLTPNIICISIAVFVYFRNKFQTAEFTQKQIETINILSKTSYGVYLVHIFFLYIFIQYGFFATFGGIWLFIAIPILSVFIYIFSFMLSFLLSKIPGINKYLI